jgi:hypothetical protein
VFSIGVDPHKASHTVVVVDGREQVVGEIRVHADRLQRNRLLRFAAPFEPRCWAIEGKTGTGALVVNNWRRRPDRAGCAAKAVGSGPGARYRAPFYLGATARSEPAPGIVVPFDD